jgi:hypothetical protein
METCRPDATPHETSAPPVPWSFHAETLNEFERADALLTLAAEQAEREQKTREWVDKTVEDMLADFGCS